MFDVLRDAAQGISTVAEPDARRAATPRAAARRRPWAVALTALMVAALATAPFAAAHRLDLFVTVEGDDLRGLAYFADGARARDVPVRLIADGAVVAETATDADGRFVFRGPERWAGQLDGGAGVDGEAQVEVVTVDGHRAVWEVPEDARGARPEPAAGRTDDAAGPPDGRTVDQIVGEVMGDVGDVVAAEAADATSGGDLDPAAAVLSPASTGGNAVAPPPAAPPAASTAAPPTAAPPAPAATAELETLVDAAVARHVDRLREELALAEDRRRLSDVVGGVGYLLGLTGLAALLWRRKGG